MFGLFLFCLRFLCSFEIVTAPGAMYRSSPAQLLRLFSIAYVNAIISQFTLFVICNRTC